MSKAPGFLALAVAVWAGEASAEGVCRYDVALESDLVLDVAIACEAETGAPRFDPAAAPFGAFVSAFHDDGAGTVGYRLDLKAWADASDSIDGATRSGSSVIATAASWLLPPIIDEAMELQVRKRRVDEDAILFAAESNRGTAFYDSESLGYAGFAIFGRFTTRDLAAGVTIAVLDGGLDLDGGALDEWVRGGLAASRTLWQGPPSAPLLVAVIPVPASGGVIFGLCRGGGGAGVAVFLGEHTEPADLVDDWVLAHELIHVGMPFVEGGLWFMEGAAVYLEPITRARAGRLDARRMWRGFAVNLARGARSLGVTPLAGARFPALYTAGAAFMLALDVAAREASGGRIGVEDCLRDVRSARGDSTGQIAIEGVVALCEATFGDALMSRFMARHVRAAAPLDFGGLMGRLGVTMMGETMTLDDTAPLAWVRKAIEAGGAVP